MRAEEALYKDIDLRVIACPDESSQAVIQRPSEQTRRRLQRLLGALPNQPRKTTYVRSFITVWDGIAHLVAKIVEAVATCVEDLDVDQLIGDDEWNVAMRQTLSSMSSSGRRFDKLRRLEIGCSRNVLAMLLGMAPIAEDIILVQRGNRHDAEQTAWPTINTAKWLCITNYELKDIAELIQNCPGLQYLQMWPATPAGLQSTNHAHRAQWFIEKLMPLSHLKTLELFGDSLKTVCRMRPHQLPSLQDLSAVHQVPCPAACRLEVRATRLEWEVADGQFVPVPALPRLKHLQVICNMPRASRQALLGPPAGSPTAAIVTPLSERMRALIDTAPALEQVDMLIPGIGRPASELGRIQCEVTIVTLVHAAETLYVVRQMTTSRPVSYAAGMETDRRFISSPRRSTPGVIQTWYESLPEPMLEFQAKFRGQRVPVEVLLAMARTDGVEQWQGRDVQLSHQAWQVLLDWYAVSTAPSLV